MSLLGILVTLWAIRRWFAPLASWAVAKSPETARAAWTDAVQFTPRVLRIGVLVFSVAFIPVTVLVTIETAIPIYGAPFVFAYVEFAIMFAAILDYFAFERLLLPMFKDIARFMPTDFVPDFKAPPLRLRIFVVITLVSIFTAIAVSAVEPEGASVTTKLVVALTVPTIVSLTLGLAPLLFLAQSVVGPIGRLQEAVGRVEASDLSVQAPVLGADEVGHLTGSFNRMVRGLRERAALHSAMGAYIDPAIAERVMAEGSSISGEAAEVTVMFVDIVGYTTLAEDAPPRRSWQTSMSSSRSLFR